MLPRLLAVVYTPADPGNPQAPIPVKIRAVASSLWALQKFGEAFWVKTFKTPVGHKVELNDLLRHNADVEAATVDVEWDVFQACLGSPGANDKAVIRRHEAYQYTGLFHPDREGEVICDGAGQMGRACDNPMFGINDVGNFMVAPIAAFNAVQTVPEPRSGALLLVGLAGVAGVAVVVVQRRWWADAAGDSGPGPCARRQLLPRVRHGL